MPFNSIPEPWKSFFDEINGSLEEEVVLPCLGGFVMIMFYGLDRPTADEHALPVGSNPATESLIGLAGQGATPHKKY